MKIKIERPNAEAAAQVFSRYLSTEIPIAPDEVASLGGGDPEVRPTMIEVTVADMYRDDTDNRFLEVTYQNGDKEILFYKDFASGAMIENIVRRAKKLAIKRFIAGGTKGDPHAGPARLDQAGVQGARGPAQHDQPRRLGEDLGQEGRAHRLHPHARVGDADDTVAGRPSHRTGADGPVPVTGRREYDVVVYGATSFVGQILCRYLTRRHGAVGKLRWAIAGRDLAKLDEVARATGADVPRIVADASDRTALDGLTASTRVVVSTVAPIRCTDRSSPRPSSKPASTTAT